MKTRVMLTTLAVLGLFLAQSAMTAEEKPGKEIKCPISGKSVNPEATAEYLGKKVYFCCEGCPNAFAKATKKHAAKANHQLVATKQAVQVSCPLTGNKLNAETAIEVAGTKVAFCCKNCQKKANKTADAKKVDLIFAKLTKGFTLQTKCPVSGKPINPLASVEHKGKDVYFCCKNCPKAFAANPAKFEDKL